MTLSQPLHRALRDRQAFISARQAEGTDAYRLFHGAAEGRPGLAVDRYGTLLLAQVAQASPLTACEQNELEAFLREQGGAAVVATRRGPSLELSRELAPGAWSSSFWCRELGLEFAIELDRARRDPQLFLDFRAAKRALRQAVAGFARPPSLLNLFAYTASVSCHALAAGAEQAWSVDFSASNLAWGEKNLRRNRLAGGRSVEEDCIGFLWAMTGRQARKKALRGRYEPRRFDLVVADPPVFAKGKFAAVDLVRDPETVFGPAWEVVAPGGLMLAANNSARVSRAEFEERLRRLLEKRSASGACESMEWLSPDPDFPSFDGEPPLKVALCRKSLRPDF
jgi:23S rRNA (cytosine1962-C5)-methyltransferase